MTTVTARHTIADSTAVEVAEEDFSREFLRVQVPGSSQFHIGGSDVDDVNSPSTPSELVLSGLASKAAVYVYQNTGSSSDNVFTIEITQSPE